MGVLIVVLLVLAAVCFGMAAANRNPGVNMVGLGLFFWVLTALIPAMFGLAATT